MNIDNFIKKYRFLKHSIVLILLRILGFKIIKVESEKELEDVKSLRYKIYSLEEYIDESKYPDGKISDEYEYCSVNIAAYYKKEIIGTLRMIHNSKYKFPTEKLFNIDLIKDRKRTVEVSKLVIDPKFRRKHYKMGRLVMYGLAIKAYRYSVKNDVRFWLANMPKKLADSFKELGGSFKIIEEKEPKEKHLKERERLSGYFKKHKLHPYILKIE